MKIKFFNPLGLFYSLYTCFSVAFFIQNKVRRSKNHLKRQSLVILSEIHARFKKMITNKKRSRHFYIPRRQNNPHIDKKKRRQLKVFCR